MVRHSQLDSDMFDSASPNSSPPQMQPSPQQVSPHPVAAPAGRPDAATISRHRAGLPTSRSPVYRKLSTLVNADVAPDEAAGELPDGDAASGKLHSRQWRSKSNANMRAAEVS